MYATGISTGIALALFLYGIYRLIKGLDDYLNNKLK